MLIGHKLYITFLYKSALIKLPHSKQIYDLNIFSFIDRNLSNFGIFLNYYNIDIYYLKKQQISRTIL